MSTPAKRKLKARRMWANYYCYGPILHYSKQESKDCASNSALGVAIPVAIIPLDDVEALIAVAADNVMHKSWPRWQRIEQANKVLTAIGVLPKSRKKGGRK